MKRLGLQPCILFFTFGALPSLWAQAGAPKTVGAGDPFMLSPFDFDRSQHGGDPASSTLSGSRLESDRKAVTSSAAVLTAGLLCDRGATALAGAMPLVAGAADESTPDFTGLNGLTPDHLGGDFGDAGSRHNRVRVHGLGAASTTVSFIDTLVFPDRCTTRAPGVRPGSPLDSAPSASPASLIIPSMGRVFMTPGQSTATAAGVALDQNTGVQDVSHPPLRGRLLAGKPVLSP